VDVFSFCSSLEHQKEVNVQLRAMAAVPLKRGNVVPLDQGLERAGLDD
jgi:hypothetical protein